MKPKAVALVGLISTTSLLALTSPALATCVQSGAAITCSGASSTAVSAADADSLTVGAGGSLSVASGDAVTLMADGAVPDGTTVTVGGRIAAADPNGADAVVLDDKDTVTVTPGGRIDGTDDAIDAGKSLTVINAGDIGAADKGINAGKKATVTNNGTIETGGEAINLSHDATIQNSGLIRSTNDRAIDVKDNARIINLGQISALGEGIETDDNAMIDNIGAIVSLTDDALNPAENAVVRNHVNALIGGEDDGIDIDSGLIINFGSIGAAQGAGVDVDAAANSLTILNYGTIRGQQGLFVEDGTAGPANTQSQMVLMGVDGDTLQEAGLLDTLIGMELPDAAPQTNLVGEAGVAAYLAGGDDVFAVQGDAAIFGDVLLGAGDDVAGFADLPSIFQLDTPVPVGPTLTTTSATRPTQVFDGGEGMDTVSFVMDQAQLLSIASVQDNALILAVNDPRRGTPYDLVLRNFEMVSLFRSTAAAPYMSYTIPELAAALSSQVPLPAGGLLLLTGVAGLGALRRRRG